MKIFAALLFFIFSMNTRAFAQEVSVLKEFAVLDSSEKLKKLGKTHFP
jgi:hypothetical protein